MGEGTPGPPCRQEQEEGSSAVVQSRGDGGDGGEAGSLNVAKTAAFMCETEEKL